MSKRVLLNTYDKEGLIDFAKALSQKYGYDITATNMVYDYLAGNGIIVEKFDWNNDNFDIVVCNFYPFNKFENRDFDEKEVIENIDTQGLSLLQKAVKNFQNTLAVSSKEQYNSVLEHIEHNDITEDFSKKLAQKAIFEICRINKQITNILDNSRDFIVLAEKKLCDLSSGENPHQSAELYSGDILSYEIIANKQLTYNNILDINTAAAIAAEFYDVCATVIVRHAMPCGAALGTTIEDSYMKAVDCDPVSAFGGVAAFTRKIDTNMAKQLSSMFLEVIIAPDFDEKVIEILSQKNMKLIKINTPLKDYKGYLNKDIKVTPFGILVQEPDKSTLEKDTFRLVTKKKPTTEIVEDMVFAWKIAKHARSNSAVIVKDLKTVGMSQGQVNRIEAIDMALDKACENSKGAILASDGAITTTDAIFDAAQGRIAAIIQPGGSSKDKEVIAAADKYELVMIATGISQLKNQ